MSIYLSIQRIAPDLLSVRATHVDYHRHPSRSWGIYERRLRVAPSLTAAQALGLVAGVLSDELAPACAVLDSFAVDAATPPPIPGQLGLPLPGL